MQKLLFNVLTSFILVSMGTWARAQSDPYFSQYMFNIQLANPAYVGTWENPGLTLISRQQWTSFENNPTSNAFSFQYPTRTQKAGFGLSVLNDKIGNLLSNSVYLDYSYGLKINKNTTFRLGLKGGAMLLSNPLSDYVIIDPTDQAFTDQESNELDVLFNLGAFISNQHFYTGLAFPNLVKKSTNFKPNFDRMIFMTGIVIRLSEGIDFKPSTNICYQTDLPIMADVNMSFLFADRVWIGALYRTSNDLNVGFNVNFLLGSNIRLGYAYDMMYNPEQNPFATGTHEVVLSIEFSRAKTKFTSPRYF